MSTPIERHARWAIGCAIEGAVKNLPEGFTLRIEIEKRGSSIELDTPAGANLEDYGVANGIAMVIHLGIQAVENLKAQGVKS